MPKSIESVKIIQTFSNISDLPKSVTRFIHDDVSDEDVSSATAWVKFTLPGIRTACYGLVQGDFITHFYDSDDGWSSI
jgi:hypothetical protein